MAYENLCMYCFQDLGGHSTCPHCGRDSHAAVPQIQMLPGTLVYHDRFLVGRALGQDATGIVYAAFDTKRENKLRIREYLPRDCAERTNDGAVVPIAGMEDKFDNGIRRLKASVEEADDPRRRHFFFEENGTAYIVQRKTASADPARGEDDGRGDDDEASGGRKRALIIALVAAIVVIGAAVALIMLFNGALNGPKDLTETPTLDPNQVWIPSESPTVTPYASPTFAALVDPDLSWMDFTFDDAAGDTSASGTAKPTAAPTLSGDASSYKNVSTKSSSSEVKKVQQRLAELGWLSSSKVTGKYDKTTRNAVLAFQKYINNNYSPAEKLAEDGIAGPKTQQWLYQVDAVKPTATPKPQVTANPTDDAVISADSSAKKIRAMQRELILLGVLPEGADNGKYDAATKSAVKRFQTRVNQLQGYDVLEVTGEMDALSMAFLDYYVDEWRKIQTATAEPTATATAQVTEAPAQYDPDSDPNPVKAGSSAEAVKSVQRRLIAIGLLPEGADDGIYGASTTRAVQTFQQWVNQQRNEQTLPMNGEADALTRAYLKYCQDNGLRPAAEVTRVPVDATVVPGTEDDVGEPEDFTIDKNSDRESIQRIQQLLSDVGLMNRKGIDGVYGSGTTRAVLAFQNYVNAHGGSLPVTGVVDDLTRRELEYYSDHDMMADGSDDASAPTEAPTSEPTAEPTEAPTAEPTAEPTEEPTEEPTAEPTAEPTVEPAEQNDDIGEDPDITVDGNSEEESIRYVQQMLIQIGALSADGATGVYDSATAKAVVDFQSWINREGIMSLEVTGTVDNGTRQMLEYCSDRELRMSIDDIDVTADENGAGPENPDDPFNEPDDGEGENEGGEGGDVPFVSSIQSVNISVDGRGSSDGPVEVGEGSFTVSWDVEGVADSYNVYVSDSAGNAIISAERTGNTRFNVDASRMNPGEVYTVTIGAIPEGGGEDDIVWRTAKFVRPVQATAEPTEAPTPEPLPTVGSVSAPAIDVSGQPATDGMVSIDAESFRISWSAEGDVQGYNVQINDANGNIITSQAGIQQTGVDVRADQMQPGMVYTIAVGAIPVNGTSDDVVWSRGQFMVPAPATPEPTAEPTEAPTPEPTEAPTPEPTVAAIGAPSVTVGGSGYQQDGVQYMTDNTIIISWGAEGAVDSYTIYVENQAGERQNLGTTTDTSRTVSAGSLPADIYTVYVGAIPMYGDESDAQWGTARFGIPAPTPEPTEAPTPEPAEPEPVETLSFDAPIDAATDSETVQQLQRRLYALSVMGGEPEQGVLDAITLQAVADFQNRVNEQYEAGLPVIDPADPGAVIDMDTLSWIVRGL